MQDKFNIKNINLSSWEGAIYIDRWTIPHTITGFALALLIPLFGFSRKTSFIITIILLTMWEVYEMASGIREPEVNRIMDIVVGLIGYGFGAMIQEKGSDEAKKISLTIAIVVALITSLIGWLAYIAGAR